jgi:hypothetical protein
MSSTVENTQTNTQSTMDNTIPQVILITSVDDAKTKKNTCKDITRHISKKCINTIKNRFNITGRNKTLYYVNYCDGERTKQNKQITYKDRGIFVIPSWDGAKPIEYMGQTLYVTLHPYGNVYIVNKSKFV